MFAPGSGRILSLYRQRQMRMERRDSVTMLLLLIAWLARMVLGGSVAFKNNPSVALEVQESENKCPFKFVETI